MSQNNSNTIKNLEAAFGGESMANRKYLFFADIARKLGFAEVSKLFRETANQETEHAFAHFRLLHPELAFDDAEKLSEVQKKAIVAKCLELAVEGETYEYLTMYPEFAEQARLDRDNKAIAEFEEQKAESREHAAIFRKAAQNFGLLTSIENHHANQYTDALNTLDGKDPFDRKDNQDLKTQKWICRQCSMIYDPVLGDIDSGIQPGTAFADIPDDWQCPICGAVKKAFVPYLEFAIA